MGATLSADAPAFFRGLTLEQANLVVDRFRAGDLEFGMASAHIVSLLDELLLPDNANTQDLQACAILKDQTAQRVFDALNGRGFKQVSALELLAGMGACSRGPLTGKVDFLFNALDFQRDGAISLDSLNIAVYTFVQGSSALTKPLKVPTEQQIDALLDGAWGADGTAQVSFEEYRAWALTFLGLPPDYTSEAAGEGADAYAHELTLAHVLGKLAAVQVNEAGAGGDGAAAGGDAAEAKAPEEGGGGAAVEPAAAAAAVGDAESKDDGGGAEEGKEEAPPADVSG